MDSLERNHKIRLIIDDLQRLRDVVVLAKTKATIDEAIKSLLAELT